jgi:hypothetical protein
MQNTITIRGKIVFDPKDVTKKHENQATWKKVAMIFLYGDLCKYYAWFIGKRYNLPLTMPLRNVHISFINDRGSETNGKWEEVKEKWNGKKIDVTLSVDPRTNSTHWWLIVPEGCRDEIHEIRAELGLGRPNFGLHMSIGYAKDCYDPDGLDTNGLKAKRMNEAHSKYIHGLLADGWI